MCDVAGIRRGFALLVVMTILAGSAAVGVEAVRRGNGAFASARNRMALTRAYWYAEGCVEILRGAIGNGLKGDSLGVSTWLRIDSLAQSASRSGRCRVVAQPSGITMDIDSVTDDQLRRLLANESHSAARIDSMVEALRDWIDPDTVPRPAGAERAWYRLAHRPEPRNGSLTSIEELSSIRGFETDSAVDILLGVESSRLVIDRAPLALLALLPGMTTEAVAAIASFRAAGRPVGDLAVLANQLSPDAREQFLSRYAEIIARTTAVPQWWTIWSESSAGEPRVRATVEVRLVQSGSEAAIVRYRTWP